MVSRDEILNLAKLSRLEFTEKELVKLEREMDNIIKFTDKISQYDCSSVQCNCKNSKTKMCCCVYEKCNRDELLRNTNSKNGFFFIKK
ncbi:MAG: aspartyl/glutamyl-tRNA amidotransferase subunit C [Firmicutes bacterium]|nr:aspartyl/glutamyl-tRNA amidotransferase subunit C [Bacillota bacterium]